LCLIQEGKIFNPINLKIELGAPNDCHKNSKKYCLDKKDGHLIGSGYALSADNKMWVKHSWVISKDATLIETTIPRSKYFGITHNPESFVD
jgi:hypothetical protein